MDFIPPYDQVGVTPPGPWTNAAPQAGLKGSIVNADVFPAVQNEILTVIDAAGLTRSAANLAQLLAAIKILIPEYAPAAPGAASKGGLAKDSGGNFLLALGNLSPDGAAIAGSDILALQRASDGSLLSGTVAQIAAFILAQQALYGASANGGLAKDGSNNFLLNLDNLPVETGFNANDKLALFTEEAEDGLAAGVPFAGTLGAIAAFIASFISTSTSGSAFNAPGVAVPKIYAWGFIDNTSGVPAFKNGSGVSSVAIGSTSSNANVIVVNLTNPLPDLNYTISASIVSDLSTNRSLTIQEAFNSRTLQSFALAMSPPGVTNNGINAKFSFLIYHT